MTISTDLFHQSTAPVPAPVKSIKWPTNYNNKMDCNAFLHIDLLPPEDKMPKREKADKVTIRIHTTDNSHTPVDVRLFDLLIIPLNKIPVAFSLASHGMDEVEFFTFMCNKHQELIERPDFTVGVYYYKKNL